MDKYPYIPNKIEVDPCDRERLRNNNTRNQKEKLESVLSRNPSSSGTSDTKYDIDVNNVNKNSKGNIQQNTRCL